MKYEKSHASRESRTRIVRPNQIPSQTNSNKIHSNAIRAMLPNPQQDSS